MNEDTVTVDTDENDYLLSKEDLMDGILNRCDDIEAVGEEAVEIAVDVTLAEVALHLSRLGFGFAAEAVDEIKDN